MRGTEVIRAFCEYYCHSINQHAEEHCGPNERSQTCNDRGDHRPELYHQVDHACQTKDARQTENAKAHADVPSLHQVPGDLLSGIVCPLQKHDHCVEAVPLPVFLPREEMNTAVHVELHTDFGGKDEAKDVIDKVRARHGTLTAVLSGVVGLRSDHNSVQKDEQRYSVAEGVAVYHLIEQASRACSFMLEFHELSAGSAGSSHGYVVTLKERLPGIGVSTCVTGRQHQQLLSLRWR
mmetsp:Transcript_3562/g.8596  ORF Transcript_3562/g.8596 Transcript_3562/m.8596 type:complete len:236 (-) Transcript_3562:358-1065(-)